jgi:hypothetical protein
VANEQPWFWRGLTGHLVRNKDNEAHANDRTKAERQSDYPTHDWRNIVSGTFHDLFDRSWAQNIIVGVVLLLITPILGLLLMSNLRGMLIGAGIGLTILFWIVWGILIKNVGPIRKFGDTPTPVASITAAKSTPIPSVTPEVSRAPSSETPLPTPSPDITIPASKSVSPKPAPVFSPASSDTNLTPRQVFDKIDSASVYNRENVRNAFVGLLVDWTLFFASASPSGENMLIIFRDTDKNDSPKLVTCYLPMKGNERFPLMNETDRFRVQGIVQKAGPLTIDLRGVSIDQIYG